MRVLLRYRRFRTIYILNSKCNIIKTVAKRIIGLFKSIQYKVGYSYIYEENKDRYTIKIQR